MKKRYGDIASLFWKIAAKKNLSSSLIPSIDGAGDIGSSVPAGEPRISGDIVSSINLINVSRTSEDNVSSSGSTPIPSSIATPVYDLDLLQQDPTERLPIISYPVND
jgi:hypothetical protein